MRKTTRTMMGAALAVCAALAGDTSTAHASCKRCLHECCVSVRGDGVQECFGAVDTATGRCLWCEESGGPCYFTPSADGCDASDDEAVFDDETRECVAARVDRGPTVTCRNRMGPGATRAEPRGPVLAGHEGYLTSVAAAAAGAVDGAAPG